MTDMTDIELLALHGLAVKKAGSPADVAGVLCRGEDEVASALEAAVGPVSDRREGHVHADARWPLVARRALSGGVCRLSLRPGGDGGVRALERINRELLGIFTDWQMMPSAGGERIQNDHSDTDYDRGIVDRLGDQHERAEKILARFASSRHAWPPTRGGWTTHTTRCSPGSTTT